MDEPYFDHIVATLQSSDWEDGFGVSQATDRGHHKTGQRLKARLILIHPHETYL